MNCYRHPEREARRRCYFCRKPICPSCQITLSHHIFCSEVCHTSWQRAEAEKKNLKKQEKKPTTADRVVVLQKQTERLARAVISLGQRLDSIEGKKKRGRKPGRARVIGISTMLMLAIVGSLAGGLVWYRSNHSANPGVADFENPLSLEDSSYFSNPPTLELAMKNIELTNSCFALYGEAPGASQVILFLNGQAVATAAPDHGSFSFQDVKLKPGANLIQVAGEDDDGHRLYSLGRLIERISRKIAKVPKLPALNYMRGHRKRMELALTFDAGAEANYAGKILDILSEKNIKTTLFLTGQFIEKYPEIVRRIVADGHEAGNHTYSHPHLTTYNQNHRHYTLRGITREFLQAELTRTAELFTAATGEKMKGWWRAPYGEQNAQLRRWAEEVGFKHVDWTRGPGRKNYDILDWVSDERSKHYLTADELYKRFVNLDDGVPGKANGGIILMHLSTDRKKDFPHLTLPDAIDAMREKGYRFVSVSQMFPE